MAYKVFTKVNYADTCRDADDIHCENLGYKNELKDAVKLANDYIKEHFFHKETELRKSSDSIIYTATDFCSYGKTINIEEIKID